MLGWSFHKNLIRVGSPVVRALRDFRNFRNEKTRHSSFHPCFLIVLSRWLGKVGRFRETCCFDVYTYICTRG